MGWERKRGKLAEFNRFVRGGAARRVLRDRGRPRPPLRARALRHHARRRHGAAAGRRARCSSARWRTRSTARSTTRTLGRVVRGYGILQPRVGVSLPSAHRSRFAAIHSGHPGRRSVHDGGLRRLPGPVRRGQLHRQGHLRRRRVRARHARPLPREHAALPRPDRGQLRARRPRHRHRASTTTTRRATSRFTRRKHRWIRGDWQLLPWLTGRACPGPDGPEPNRLSLLSRWKILDNLRRSTVEIAQLAFLVAGWTVLPGSPLRWTLLGLLAPSRRRGSSRCCSRCSARRSTSRGAPTTRRWAATRSTSAQQVGARRSCSCRTRPGSRPTRSCARSGACSSRAGTCSSGRRRRRPSARSAGAPGAAWRAMWPAVALAARAAGAGDRRRPRSASATALDLALARRGRCRCVAAVARRRRRSPMRSARRRCAASGGSPPRSATAGAALRAAALALLRALRHREHALARARQLPGGSRAGRGDAHLADQHRPPAAGHGQRATTSGSSPRDDMAERLELAFRSLERDAALPGPLLQLVRPARPAACSSRRTSPRWTAATSPATSSRCGRPASISPTSRCSTRASGGRSTPASRWRSERLPRACPSPTADRAAGARAWPRRALALREAESGTAARSRPLGAPSVARARSRGARGCARRSRRPRRRAARSSGSRGASRSSRSTRGRSSGLRRGADPSRGSRPIARRHRGADGDPSLAAADLLRRSRDRGARRPTRWRWTSASSSTTSASCSPSATSRRTHALDGSYYDLLASEARLASFVADRQERRAGGALVPARAHAHARGAARRRWCRGAAACSST